jgi:hypothetical protein
MTLPCVLTLLQNGAMGTNALPPDLQSVLETLFALFAAYVAAATVSERDSLHAQILDLFSRLGVAPRSPLVRQAAEIFERIRQEPLVKIRPNPTLAGEARDFTNARLRNYERRQGLTLSTGARQMLRVPIVETAEFADRFDPEQTDRSLSTVLATLKDEAPVTDAEGNSNMRTSVAVIRAFWKNFCNIPPFCRGKN